MTWYLGGDGLKRQSVESLHAMTVLESLEITVGWVSGAERNATHHLQTVSVGCVRNPIRSNLTGPIQKFWIEQQLE